MSGWTCHIALPDYAALKAEFEKGIYAPGIRGYGSFYQGLGYLEQIDLDACLAGNTAPDQASLGAAHDAFAQARHLIDGACKTCVALQRRLPPGPAKRLRTPIDKFQWMVALLDEVIGTLTRGGIPSLENIHQLSALMIEDLIVGAYLARVNRSSPGHHPYPGEAGFPDGEIVRKAA
jgi:hypothetical protein